MPPQHDLSRPPVSPGNSPPGSHSPLTLFFGGVFALLVISAGFFLLRGSPRPAERGAASACPTPPRDVPLSGSLESALSQVAAGATITVSGSIQNPSQEAVNGATLYAKILRQESGMDYPVDFFPLTGTVSIPAGSSAPVSVSWTVPPDAINGQYVLGLALFSGDASLEAGVPTPGGPSFASYPFTVTAGVDRGTAFAPASLLVNGAAVPPGLPIYVDGASPTRLDLEAANDSGLGVKTMLTWTLYAGAFPVGTPLSATSTALKVQPGASAKATFISSDYAHSTYYLIGSFTTKNGAQSLVGLRLLNGAFLSQCAATSTPPTP